MSARDDIHGFLNRSKRAVVLLAISRGFLRGAPVLIAGFVALSGLDQHFEFPAWWRRLMWVLLLAGSGGLFASGFFPLTLFSLRERSRRLHRAFLKRGGTFRPDELPIAVGLLAKDSAGTSSELKDLFLERLAATLKEANPFWSFPAWNWKRPAVAAVSVVFLSGLLSAGFPAAFPMAPRTLFPFGLFDDASQVRVTPGDARVPWGEDVTVEVRVMDRGAAKPTLYVRTGDDWQPLEPKSENAGVFTYVMAKVVSPLSYRVEWRKEWSRKYTLTPAEPVRVKSFDVRLTPPDYTGRPPLNQTSPEINGLPGTRVRLEAAVSIAPESASIVFSNGQEKEADSVAGETAAFSFVIESERTYVFRFKTKTGETVTVPETYSIHAAADQPPTIQLLSPEEDLVIGDKEKVPLTYNVQDDAGVGEVTLVWETNSGRSDRVRVKTFDGAVPSLLATHEWELAPLRFQPGEIVRYKLEAKDKNTVTGPGVAATPWHLIEIQSFEREHAALEKALEVWRDRAVETLANANTLKAKAEKEGADLNALAPEAGTLQEKMNALETVMKRIVEKMEKDPMADYGVWMEHQSMLDNLSQLNKTSVPNARAALQTENKEMASAELGQISNELERMTALSENLSKTQKARDVVDAGEKLEEIGEDLEKALKSGGPDAEIKRRIADLIEEAQKNLAEMARALQQMPDELPEDFVNQQALKNLDMAKSQDILSQISEAMKAGDMQKALDLAKKFSAAAQKMRKQLSEAHDSFLKDHSAEELGKKIKEQQGKLEAVTDEQRALLAATQKHAAKELEAMLKEQEALLLELAERQSKVVAGSDNLLKTGKWRSAPVGTMRQVEMELRSKRLERTLEWLPTIIDNLKIDQAELAKSSDTTIASRVQAFQVEEMAILEKLKTPMEPNVKRSDSEKNEMDALQKRQEDLSKKTQALKQDIQTLSQKTASLGLPVSQALSKAASDMSSASSKLGEKKGRAAQRSEESALSNLMEGQSMLESAAEAMAGMSEQSGGGSGGNSGGGPAAILRSAGGGGSRGTQMKKVKLPNAEDYRAPKAFREDLLESLKENYPKIYEDIIHKYFKHLAE